MNQNGQLQIRNLSCYCAECMKNNSKDCINLSHVSPFSKVSFSPDAPSTSSSGMSEPLINVPVLENEFSVEGDETVSLASLAVRGSIVAVRPNMESVYDYFLFKVTSDGIMKLTTNTSDGNGLPFTAGSEVLGGFFFEIDKETCKGSFYRLLKKQSYIHKDTVVSVGIELDELDSGMWCLKPLGHAEVMLSLF